MVEIIAKRLLTVHLEANEIYRLKFDTSVASNKIRINILNNTIGDVLISDDALFADGQASGDLIVLPTSAAINNLPVNDETYIMHIKARSSGDIVIVRCG